MSEYTKQVLAIFAIVGEMPMATEEQLQAAAEGRWLFGDGTEAEEGHLCALEVVSWEAVGRAAEHPKSIAARCEMETDGSLEGASPMWLHLISRYDDGKPKYRCENYMLPEGWGGDWR